ncbi:MAG: entericidin A/B family lipoprotein [Rhodocyclaceae bacterium]|nr:entericidin A/B family lipoprotein [Rhodocyclaceae bacterium]MBX3666927.1 entericidin A/B family lipoprotein [Rhodocyclaceae bacterium]
MRRLAAVMAVAIGMVSLAGCNTVAGVGKDIKKGGEAIEKAAK